jgi:phage baseplate assembly protein W
MSQNTKYINIDFPFQDSKEGFFLQLNNVDNKAIRADLMHLILTKKGERFYNPEFGTNLLKYIFEPNDSLTLSDIKLDIQTTVKKYIPNLNVDNITVEPDDNNEYHAIVRLDYTITDDVFKESDFIIINL